MDHDVGTSEIELYRYKKKKVRVVVVVESGEVGRQHPCRSQRKCLWERTTRHQISAQYLDFRP